MARCNAGRLNIAKLPSCQYANKQKNRQPNPHTQRQGHFVSFGTLLEHEIQGGTETGKNGDERNKDKVFHAADYPVNANPRFALITLSALLAAALTAGLGVWQLSRAAEKQAVASSMLVRGLMPPLSTQGLVELAQPQSEFYRRTELRGHWLAEHTVFLDNRQMNAKPGLFIITPLALADSSLVLLVQRGWVARNFLDRNSLPQVDTPGGMVSITGLLVPPPSKLYELGPPESRRLRQNLDIAVLRSETGLALMPLSVQQTDTLGDGLQRDWQRPAAGVDKHYGYAFQWFGLSALIALLYVWFQLVKRPPTSD